MINVIKAPLHKTGTAAPHDGTYTPHSHEDGSVPHPEAGTQVRAGTPLPACKTCGKPVRWIWAEKK